MPSLELTKECGKLRKEAAAKGEGGGGGGGVTGDVGVAWEELQVVRSERDQAVQQAKTLGQSVAGLQHENQVSHGKATKAQECDVLMWYND